MISGRRSNLHVISHSTENLGYRLFKQTGRYEEAFVRLLRQPCKEFVGHARKNFDAGIVRLINDFGHWSAERRFQRVTKFSFPRRCPLRDDDLWWPTARKSIETAKIRNRLR